MLVSASAIMVRPWNASSKAMMPGRPVWARAIFTAFSTASAPVFTNNVFLGNLPGVSCVQPLRQADVAFVWRHLNTGMKKPVELRSHRR